MRGWVFLLFVILSDSEAPRHPERSEGSLRHEFKSSRRDPSPSAPLPVAATQDDATEAENVSKAVIPVVGSVQGGDAIWRTELTLLNTTGTDVFVAMTLVADPEESFWSTMLAVGDTVTFTDVSQEAFGKTGILSPLLIQTVGSRSITVSAAAYSERQGTVSAPQTVPVIYGEPKRAVMRLGPVTFDDEFRTNLGLVNLNDQPVSFTVSLQRLAGRNLAVQNITVNPRSMVHSLVTDLFPLVDSARGITILVDPTAGNTYAYASMVRNADNEARFFAPR